MDRDYGDLQPIKKLRVSKMTASMFRMSLIPQHDNTEVSVAIYNGAF